MKRKFFLLFFAVAAFAIDPILDEAVAEDLTLQYAISEALDSNPEILSARRSFEAASARIWQAASLDDPMIGYEYNKMTANRSLTGVPMRSYFVSQEVPFPTKLYLRAKIASKMARMSYEAYEAKKTDIISRVKSIYSELFLVYRSIDVANESRNFLEQFSNVAARRYATGSGTQSDALKAQVELARVDNELIILEQRRLTVQARLNILMNKDPREEIGAPSAEESIEFDRPLEEFYIAARQNNPELKMYRYGIERGKAAYDLSLNEFMPDFTLRYQQSAMKDMANKKNWAGMLGITVPLWFFQKQAFGVKEMKSELEMLKAEYRTKENMVLFDVRDAYARVEASRKIVELFETAFIPQAYETMKAVRTGYESSQSDFLTLLDSERMFIGFKLDHYKSILDLRIALADLERAVGTGLDSVTGLTGNLEQSRELEKKSSEGIYEKK